MTHPQTTHSPLDCLMHIAHKNKKHFHSLASSIDRLHASQMESGKRC